MIDYNPDIQIKLIRNNVSHAELALNESIPSLGLLSSTYGEETPIEWLKIQIGTLNDFAEVKNKMGKEQIDELCQLILSEYYYLNAAEILFFIVRFKIGKYGQFFGTIDPIKITSALITYTKERRIDIERVEKQQYLEKKKEEMEKNDKNIITYKEYLAIKDRAEAGDKEAIEILKTHE